MAASKAAILFLAFFAFVHFLSTYILMRCVIPSKARDLHLLLPLFFLHSS
jgi:hypothetical protein